MDMSELRGAVDAALEARNAEVQSWVEALKKKSVPREEIDALKTKCDNNATNLIHLSQQLAGMTEGRLTFSGGGARRSTPGSDFTKALDLAEFERTGRTGKIAVASVFSVKAAGPLTTATAGTAASPDFNPAYPAYTPRFIDTFTRVPFGASVAVFPQIALDGIDNQADIVPELQPKPQTTITAVLQTQSIPTFAHWTQCSKQVLDDSANLQQFIDSVLISGLLRKADAHFVGQILATAAPLQVTADNLLDASLYGAAALDERGRTATNIALNTTDLITLMTQKDSAGRYVFDDLQTRLNLELAYGSSITAGQVLVYDKTAATLLERQQPTVEASAEAGDNFVSNQVTVRAEARLWLANYDLNGFVSVSLQTAPPLSTRKEKATA